MKILAKLIADRLRETFENKPGEISDNDVIGCIREVLDVRLQSLLVNADSELSAVAHGRPCDKTLAIDTAHALRAIYEGKA